MNMPWSLPQVPSGNSCEDGVVLEKDPKQPPNTSDNKVQKLEPPSATRAHLQLLMPSHKKLIPGKKYESINNGPSSPNKTLSQATLGSRTASTGTMNTQSLTSSSPDSTSNFHIHVYTSANSEEDCPKALPHIEESPLERDLFTAEYSQNNPDKNTNSMIRKPMEDVNWLTLDESPMDRIQVETTTTVESMQETDKMENGIRPMTRWISESHGILRDFIVDGEVDEDLSSCYEDEELDISLNPTLVTVTSDITEKSYADSVTDPIILDRSSDDFTQSLNSLLWGVMTRVSSCFANDPTRSVTNNQDDASARLSTLNPLALCGLRR